MKARLAYRRRGQDSYTVYVVSLAQDGVEEWREIGIVQDTWTGWIAYGGGKSIPYQGWQKRSRHLAAENLLFQLAWPHGRDTLGDAGYELARELMERHSRREQP